MVTNHSITSHKHDKAVLVASTAVNSSLHARLAHVFSLLPNVVSCWEQLVVVVVVVTMVTCQEPEPSLLFHSLTAS